jgi:transposase
MLADRLDYVIGVDTHRDQHVLAIVVAATGALVAQRSVPTNTRGYADAVRFADDYAPGARLWAVEGAGHYGAGLTRYLDSHAEAVHEVSRASRAERRTRGKDDALDTRAARSALASETDALPRSGQHQEALRLLLLARRSAVDVRRVALVQLRSVIVTAPEELRDQLRRLPAGELLRRCSRFRRSSSRTPAQLATILVLRSLAQPIQAATEEAAELEREILNHVRTLVPQLLNEPDVGPIVAAQLIVTWSHHGRVSSEAAFARLAGVAPLPASSGQTTRHHHPRLHLTPHRRRQNHQRRRPPPQALPRPPPLPRHAKRHPTHHLTVIGASDGGE